MLSIVIPSYNHEKYIAAAVQSCFDQTLDDIEIIVVDDGSKDRSLNYLRSVQAPYFTLIEQANAGAHNAINRGLEQAAGDYIAILNSDDVFDPERFRKMIAAMERSGADFACSWIRQINALDETGPIKEGWHNQLPSWLRDMPPIDVGEENAFLKSLTFSNFISTTSNMVFSRSLYQQIGGMRNLRFAHDWDFAFRASLAGTPLLVEECLLDYRTHETNTIRTNHSWMMFEVLWCLAVHLPAVHAHLHDDKLADDVEPKFDLGEKIGVYREISRFLRDRRTAGVDRPEEILLNNPDSRAHFVEAIQ